MSGDPSSRLLPLCLAALVLLVSEVAQGTRQVLAMSAAITSQLIHACVSKWDMLYPKKCYVHGQHDVVNKPLAIIHHY